ncbi:MAG TPA: hypothetical protein DDY20_10980 [Desulfobulbaceae bacterium]|nr:hypothetical protein [Desulfobulbaceae bacterium]
MLLAESLFFQERRLPPSDPASFPLYHGICHSRATFLRRGEEKKNKPLRNNANNGKQPSCIAAHMNALFFSDLKFLLGVSHLAANAGLGSIV